MSEDLQERDHRVLGPALDLFSFSQFSPGIAFWHPRGMIVYNQLVNLMRKEYQIRGFQEVKAPLILNADLWRQSGHYEMFKKNMFFLESEGQEFALKPMNCPGHCVMIGQKIRSYREFPIRYAEFSQLHRNENSGALNGLKRVRSFAQDDAHIFCLPEQIESEVSNALIFLQNIYKIFGFKEYKIELSLRPEQSIGSEEIWNNSEKALREALIKNNLSFEEKPKEGAFYGPKIDFHIKDTLNRYWQCGTIQLDFNLPERFDLNYRDKENQLQRLVMIHRAIYGSFDRMVACLIEHWNGNFPLWIAPEQIRLIPISTQQVNYAEKISILLQKNNIRFSIDSSSDSLSKRIKVGLENRVPYLAILGQKEEQDSSISLRRRDKETQSTLPLEYAIDTIKFLIDIYG